VEVRQTYKQMVVNIIGPSVVKRGNPLTT